MTGRCEIVRDELAAYQSGDGSVGERDAIRSHLQTCAVCQREAVAQAQMRESLRSLKALTENAAPPARVWKNAVKAWDQRDARRRVRFQLRMAFAGACLLLFAFGVVWARNAQPAGFPVGAAMQDFAQVELGQNVTPQFASRDADKAAQWLEQRLGVHIPAMNLELAGARLIGANVLPNTTPATGRLLYRTNLGVMALYITPGGSDFGSLRAVVLNNYRFSEYTQGNKIGILGWDRSGVGYGLALRRPLERGKDVAAEACRTTE